ncbi:EscU/YscU/HrcU family type III secretion system export apparatus switch protein [Amphritea sp. 2_MG-2023]|jgi:flagellar biosynthesis protein|uniref:EscU/YscU/HrcU family type III secretion system export apparatus switch protein n=1 Tax=Amphritea TaxID=515417 RepID=UPI001C064CFD|nr:MULTISPECIES: EscU/YscU/HrcU family type III secretion system export apparatus switch protein [Amphritea]MBU2964794.1 EscU/YscU/HrcU family type III secretion system export apparatus switch protein [Amphritea atlantica]MDO6419630.1 EscU/YscU/HrcU family type III secretion system export apparatus switch protein [Amphritea sp. 2_MG-2023]MDX2422828.1 EscU/YscU/HrcU family type III secretion system export apparatus switch protein [Amphritea sp.]
MSKKADEYQKAIALNYDHEGAPTVTAKGQGVIAEQIIRLAREHDVHIHESPELVEVLLRLELGDEIPEALYRAIAEIIAFTYKLKNGTD